MKTLYPLFFKHITENVLIEKDSPVIVALSGGKDSVTLIHLLKRLQQDVAFQLIAAYFNHQIRDDREQEERWVKGFCRDLDIPLETGREDVIRFSRENKLNLEHAASLLRYRFLSRLSDHFAGSKIATGHTKSDLAETFFINLFRGSGSRGLSGIYIQKGKNIIRPLLIFSHEDIHGFLNRNQLTFYADYSNRDNTYIRNRIRNTLIPAVKKIEPRVEDRIFRTVSLIQDQHDYLTEQSRIFLERNLILGKIMPMKRLKTCHIALQRYIVREYIRRIKGDLLNIGFQHVETILNEVPLTAGSLPGIGLVRGQDFLFPRDFSIPEYQYSLYSGDSVTIREIEQTIRLSEISRFHYPRNNFEIIIPRDSIRFPLLVRNARKEDCYRKINSGTKQAVYEMIRSSGIPAGLRNYCPLLLNASGDPIWVAGSPISEAFKVTAPDQKPLIKITTRSSNPITSADRQSGHSLW